MVRPIQFDTVQKKERVRFSGALRQPTVVQQFVAFCKGYGGKSGTCLLVIVQWGLLRRQGLQSRALEVIRQEGH